MRVNFTSSARQLLAFALMLSSFTLFAQPANNECSGAIDVNSLFGQPIGMVQASGLFDNTMASSTLSDPTTGLCFAEPNYNMDPQVSNSLWFTFTGDGGTYYIETDDCGSSNYITNGDTQIAIYGGTGGQCSSTLSPIACNEDGPNAVNGDFKAGLSFATMADSVYFIMVDGFSDNGAAAAGEYCLTVVQELVTTCADISAGTVTAAAQIVCFGDNTDFTLEDVVIPNNGPAGITGFRWLITGADVSGLADPGADPSYAGAFGQSASPYTPVFANNGTQLPTNTFVYFTPVSYAGAVDTGATAGFFEGLDFSNGCLSTGTSVLVLLAGDNGPITANPYTLPASDGASTDGEAGVNITGGGSLLYDVLWDTGADTDTITGLAPGDYTVTITDQGGCVDSLVLTITVDSTAVMQTTCADVSAGTVTAATQIVCFGDNTDFTLEDAVIPNAGPAGIAGFRWIITGADVSGLGDPGADPSYVGAFGESPTPYTPVFANNGTQLQTNVFVYFTPVSYAGAVDTGAMAGFFEGLDFSNGCLATGNSVLVLLAGDNGAITADPYTVAATSGTPFNGAAGVNITGGGSLLYDVLWDTGADTDTITGLEPGDYMVTITDQGGCVDSLVITITVQDSIPLATFSPEFDAALQMYPNPAQNWTQLDYNFNTVTDLTLRLTNVTGQLLKTEQIKGAANGRYRLDLEEVPSGVYFLQISDENNRMTKRLIVE